MELHLQDYGENCKLFISSPDRQEIQYQYYSLYNRMATSGALNESPGNLNGNPTFFIWTSKKNLLRYFYSFLENNYYLKFGREADDGSLFSKELLRQAAKKIEQLPRLRTIESVKNKIYGGFEYSCNIKCDHSPD